MSKSLIRTETGTILKFSKQIEVDEQMFPLRAAITRMIGIPILRKGKKLF